MPFNPTAIDLSGLAPPNAIEPLSAPQLLAGFIERFLAFWNAERAKNPALPEFNVQTIQGDPAVIVGRTWSWLRLLDRGRVNNAIRSLLAPLARGTDLDHIAASANVTRLVVTPADPIAGTPAVMESDAALLLRYLLAWDMASAGSPDRYEYEARTAWPGIGGISVLGYGVHKRRGDVHVVICGPGGRAPTEEEFAVVSAALRRADVKPEATGLSLLIATRVQYVADLLIDVPKGPDKTLIEEDAARRVRAAADERAVIGGEVPPGLISGVAYGPNVIRVQDNAPFSIASDPYSVPVCAGITVKAEVRK